MTRFKIKYGASLAFKLTLLVFVCIISLYLLPKTGVFQYHYQKGMPWRYETLAAPFDFPIYKTEAELIKEREDIIQDNMPVFVLDGDVLIGQLKLFSNKINSLSGVLTKKEINDLLDKLDDIYDVGIILWPERFDAIEFKQIKLIKNNIVRQTKVSELFTLKQAYEELYDYVKKSRLSESAKEKIIALNLNKYLQVNLIYDDVRTMQAIESQLNTISLTREMVSRGTIIINKRELVTNEKFILLNSLKEEYEHSVIEQDSFFLILGGQLIIVLSSLLVFSLYFLYSKKSVFSNNKEFIFMYGAYLATTFIASLGFQYNFNMLMLPTLTFVLVVNLLIGNRSALYLLLSSTLLISYFVPNSYMYVFMQLVAGIVAIFSLRSLQSRGQLFLSLFYIFIAYSTVYAAFVLIQNGEVQLTQLYGFVWIAINCLLLSLSYAIIFIFEKLFGYVSDITLVELSNPNHPLLRALVEKAPGTYQHSTMVAGLADEAVYVLGGNSLLARVGAFYHDIGKTYDPLYYIENQSGGINPHSKLDYAESAQKIISHVIKGVELAHKYKLPKKIIDFIKTHHGRSKTLYFYNSFKNAFPDKEINEELFTYDGPDPVSKECTVVMMADSIEAASRSLSEKTEENITNLVNSIIDAQKAEGRFDNSDITFGEITKIKSVFIERLTSIYHSRIAYPKLEVNNE